MPDERVEINLFRPATESLRREVRSAAIILGLWAVLSFGVPLLIWLAGLGDPSGLGESMLTRARFLGFPLHYWLLAQGCTVGYVLLCKFYCILRQRGPAPRHPSGGPS